MGEPFMVPFDPYAPRRYVVNVYRFTSGHRYAGPAAWHVLAYTAEDAVTQCGGRKTDSREIFSIEPYVEAKHGAWDPDGMHMAVMI